MFSFKWSPNFTSEMKTKLEEKHKMERSEHIKVTQEKVTDIGTRQQKCNIWWQESPKKKMKTGECENNI